jgi:transcriptional regulator with XRE-family HTH domain
MTARTTIRFEDWEAEQMQDPGFRAAVEELEPAYQVARLRIARGLTQEQLAELVGTKQSSIARLESGNTQPSLSFLRRVVEALDGRLQLQIVPQEEAMAPARVSVPTTDQPETQPVDGILVRDWPRLARRHRVDDYAAASASERLMK